MKPLRAYLLLRSPSGDVDISTHRDLESVENVWRERLFPEASAALHVGYWRPDTKDFLEALSMHPGRILVSAAAVHALPPHFRSSSKPVASASTLPLHLALTGWGYEIQDPSNDNEVSGNKNTVNYPATAESSKEILEIQCEWLQKFAQLSPELFEQALNTGVIDDASYLELEKNLPEFLQDCLGEARFRWYCPIPSAENIIDYIAFTPMWFQSLPVAGLTLTKRSSNILAENSIRIIGDFRRYTARKVLAFPRMGLKSFHEIGNRLLSILSAGISAPLVKACENRTSLSKEHNNSNNWMDVRPNTSLPTDDILQKQASEIGRHKDSVDSTLSFTEALETSFKSLTEQERHLLKMRMGMEGEPMTLMRIGEAWGISRERVRQVENLCIRKFTRLPYWSRILGPKIQQILEERDDYLSPYGLEIIDETLKGAANSPHMLEYILEKLVKPEFHLVKEGSEYFVTEIKQQEWVDKVKAARQLLEALVERRPSIQEARSMVDALLVDRGRELRAELWAAAIKNAHFSNEKLIAYGLGAEHAVLAVLESSEAPLHYSDIFNILSKRGYDYDLRRVHNAVAEVGLLYARGTYGTMRHFPLDEINTLLVISEAEDLIGGEGANRQWHAREICDRLEELGIDCDGNLTPYVITISLRKSNHLTYLGRMIWASKSTGAKGAANRLDLHQAVVSILIENGEPMVSNEIKDRLAAERGVNSFFQIQPEGRLVRVGAGVWGLMDRDIPFTEEESQQLMNTLRSALLVKRKGIHSSEIFNEVSSIEPMVLRVEDPILILGLAQKFEGFSVSKGQYLYLTEWGGPRRLNLREALTRVLNDAGKNGITIRDGMARVSELLERPFPSNMFFGQLSYSLGARYNEETKHWLLTTEDESLHEERDEI